MKRTLALLTFAFVASFGCSDSSGPKTAAVSGTWTYSASNVQGSGETCNSTGTTMTLTQSGSTFTGTYAGGTLTCTGVFGSLTQQIGSGVVANGTVSGSSVSFNFDTTDWTNTGSMSGTTMTGSLVIRVTVGATSAVLTGTFSAAKQ